MSIVYHVTFDRRNRDLAFDMGFNPSVEKVLKEIFFGGVRYVPVARVEVPGREKAFELTNSIDSPWWHNEGVKPCFIGAQCRSTSVGDVIEVEGTYFLCVAAGWRQIDIDLRLHHLVNSALDNREDNGYPLESNAMVAVDLVTYDQFLEDVDPALLPPHIQAWRHHKLGKELNLAIQGAKA